MNGRSARIAIHGILAAFALSAQKPTTPTFRSEANYIEVDVFVTNKSGEFVRDLRRDDFELRDDGQPQEIATFSLVDIPVTRQTPRKESLVDTDIATNVGARRVYVMLIEPLQNASSVRVAQNVALQFVEEALGANDMMAVIHPQGSTSHAQTFTSNKALLRASIERLPQSVLLSGGVGLCDSIRLRFTYETIEEVAQKLGAISGRRKAILWIGGRIPFDCGEGAPAALSSAIMSMHRDAIRAATRNNVAIYPVDPLGLAGLDLKGAAALRLVAEDTGGEAIVNTNDFRRGFEHVVRDNSTYYLLGYYPTGETRDGKFHDIAVRVKRPGLTLRARPGYYALEPTSKVPVPVAVASGLAEEARRALRSPLPTNGLSMEMFVAPFKGSGRNGSVLVGARVHGADLKLDADDQIEIADLAIDTNGTVTPGARRAFTLNLRTDTRARVSAEGFSYFDRLSLPPGRHEVRLVVHQPNGAIGSVVTHVEVPDFVRGPLTMSGIVLGSENAVRDRTLLGDKQLEAVLTTGPTVRRRFERSDALTAFVEVYTEARVPLEDLRLTATLTTARNTKVVTEPGTLTTNDPGRAGYTVRLPLAKLSPGEYVLMMETKVGRRTASRQVLFVVE